MSAPRFLSILVLTVVLSLFAPTTASTARAQADEFTLTTLHFFDNSDAESVREPTGGIIQGTDGAFYGTTVRGGAANGGTVYRITADGAYTMLHDFSGPDGETPQAGLLQASDGNFYGTTFYGGVSGRGTIFRLTPAGELTVLHSFADDETGAFPTAPLIQGRDGNFYGTTSAGTGDDPLVNGAVFRLTPDGIVTALHTFTGGDDGVRPGALFQAADGNFYGPTGIINLTGGETIFRVTPEGVFTTLHRFQDGEGHDPMSALVQGADGNFYGTTSDDGPGLPGGTVFRMTPDGALTTLHAFTGPDGWNPVAGLTPGRDGNFYGGTSLGGYETGGFQSNAGTLFQITPGGVLTTIHFFTGIDDGSGLTAPLVQTGDGSFYGTTSSAEYNLHTGSVFRLMPGPSGPPTVPTLTATVAGGSVPRGGGTYGSILLTLASPPPTDVVVSYKVKGSARPGVDYYPLRGKIRIKAGKTHKFLYVFTRYGAFGLAKKVVRIRLQPGEGYTLGTDKPLKIKLTPYE